MLTTTINLMLTDDKKKKEVSQIIRKNERPTHVS